MAGGFITLQRQILDWEWYKNTNTKSLFLHLILTANYTEGNFHGLVVKRGQCVTSLTRLAEQTGLSVRQVRVSLDHLKMTGEVTSESYPRYSVITVVKYDEYQFDDRVIDTQMTRNAHSKRSENDKEMTRNASAKRQQYNNIINNKETNEKENNNSLSAGEEDGDRYFDLFWQAYPKKVSKTEAMKAWKKVKPDSDPILLMTVMNGLALWKMSPDWNRDNGRYIPYPATWLNQRRWEDEILKEVDKNPVIPVRKAPAKTVTAQQYEQRDYSDIQAQIDAERDQEMEEWLRSRGGA